MMPDDDHSHDDVDVGDEAKEHTYHIYPLDDLKPHVIDGQPCPCNPLVETISRGGVITGWMITHNSFDGREAYETGQRKPH